MHNTKAQVLQSKIQKMLAYPNANKMVSPQKISPTDCRVHNYERHLSYPPLKICNCLFNIYSQQLEACIKSVLPIFTFISQTFTSFVAELCQFLGLFLVFFLVMLRRVSNCLEAVCYFSHVFP